MQSKIITIDSNRVGQRIDNFLVLQLKGVPHSRIYRAVRKGEVRVNKKRVDASYKLKENDQVRIPPIRVSEAAIIPKPSAKLTELLKKSVIFENSDFMVINKPAGLAVHGGSEIELGLVEALRAIKLDWKSVELAHRLDRETSGCLLLAKNRLVLLTLQDLFRTRDIEKIYLLLVDGDFSQQEHVKTFLTKTDRGGEKIISVSDDDSGKNAETIFTPVSHSAQFSLLRAHLLTGRMHQIRVHAAHIGHPIVGDAKYGDKKINQEVALKCGAKRLFLHAQTLSFTLGDKSFKFEALLDEDFLRDLKKLGVQLTDK